jgi:hypothetical protein
MTMADTREQPRLGAGSNDGDIDLLRAAPVIARLAVAAWMRATTFTVQASLSASSRVVRGAANGESPAELIREVEDELRQYLRRLLGVENGDGSVAAEEAEPVDAEVVEDDRPTPERLQDKARDLLRRSADVHDDDDTHPAFERILENLAPDEARVLRLLLQEGPQAAVDVRTVGPLAVGRSELVAPGLNMIAPAAGCRHPKRVHSYLNNLYRLGLIWFSREPLEDPLRYQVLEAQPEVTDAMEKAGRGKTVRRSIHLTAFGDEFCRVCLPIDTGEIDALPRERGGRP